MRKFYFLSVLIFWFLLFMTAWISVGIKSVAVYINVPSIVIVLLCSFILLLSNYSLKDIRKYFSMGFKISDPNITELKNGIVFFSALQRYFILAGLLGTFFGIIALLTFLADPKAIGSGMALALMTALYAIILNMSIAMPFKTGLQRRLNELVK